MDIQHNPIANSPVSGRMQLNSFLAIFSSFEFLQLAVLFLANHAGEGWLLMEQRVMVYYVVQIFVITGFLFYAFYAAVRKNARWKINPKIVPYCALGFFFTGAAVMLTFPESSICYLISTFAACLCLGILGGAVYERMAYTSSLNLKVVWIMGMGYAAAVVARFLLQILWGRTPLLPVFMLAALLLLAHELRQSLAKPESGCWAGEEKILHVADFLPRANKQLVKALDKDKQKETGHLLIDLFYIVNEQISKQTAERNSQEEGDGVSCKGIAERPVYVRVLITALISVMFSLFISFYNVYIHNLQIQTSYIDFNVYSAPRIMLIPCFLFFASIGDEGNGKFIPLSFLCVILTALLNSVLARVDGEALYWFNMCLFYIAVSASFTYYNLSFWRLAQKTRNPALWASMGRVLDSAIVFLTGLLHISSLPAAAVLSVNILCLAAIIILMALNGDLDFSTLFWNRLMVWIQAMAQDSWKGSSAVNTMCRAWMGFHYPHPKLPRRRQWMSRKRMKIPAGNQMTALWTGMEQRNLNPGRRVQILCGQWL